jgi:hypothetical protein
MLASERPPPLPTAHDLPVPDLFIGLWLTPLFATLTHAVEEPPQPRVYDGVSVFLEYQRFARRVFPWRPIVRYDDSRVDPCGNDTGGVKR